MGMRKYQREVARNRLKCMGVGNVNRKMHGKFRITKGKIRKMMGTKLGRKQLSAIVKSGVANWRRVLYGDLAAQAYMAQCHPEELKRKKRQRRMIGKPR